MCIIRLVRCGLALAFTLAFLSLQGDAQTPKTPSIALRIGGGLKASETQTRKTNSGYFFDIHANIPAGNRWWVRGGYSFWSAKSPFVGFEDQVHVSEISVGPAYDFFQTGTLISSAAFTLGAGKSTITPVSEAQRPESHSGLLTINLELGFSYRFVDRLLVSVYIRKQLAGSPNPGGGEAFVPYLVGLGLVVPI